MAKTDAEYIAYHAAGTCEEDKHHVGYGSERAFEMVPGALVWATLISAVLFSYLEPIWVMHFIILFDLFWTFRVSYFVVLLFISWRKHVKALKTDWWALVKDIEGRREIWHVVLLPMVNEDIHIVRNTLESIRTSTYPTDERFVVVLGGEARKPEPFLSQAETLKKEFGGAFTEFIVTQHPDGVPGEEIGKGSNIHYMGHKVQEWFDERGVPYEKVILSSFDVDTVVHPEYFSCLTYKYLTHPNPTRSSYQPITLYNNNIWDAPSAVRVAAFGTTFWLMSELSRPERLFTFSSHSMPLKALVDVGFWERDIVSEDSRIFLQCMLRYDGDYHVTPIHLPVSMDACMGESYAKSLVNLYKQQRRWAWGVEHFPYLMGKFRDNPRIPLKKKAWYIFTVMEGMYTWATVPLLIFVLGYLPLWLAPDAAREAVFYQNTPHILETLMQLSLIGVFVSALLGFALLPPRPKGIGRHTWLIMVLQWALVPFTFVIFGSFPAIDAQTRMMFGNYLGYNLTEKKRKGASAAPSAPSGSS